MNRISVREYDFLPVMVVFLGILELTRELIHMDADVREKEGKGDSKDIYICSTF